MTREEKLYSMTMACLIEVADKLGIKVHKKGKKSDAIAKILAKEAEIAEENRRADEAEYIAEVMAEKAELGIECPPITGYKIVSGEYAGEVVGDYTKNENVAGDGTPLAEVGKEIAEEAKIKAAKAIVKKMSAKKVAKIVDKADKKEKAKREKIERVKFDPTLEMNKYCDDLDSNGIDYARNNNIVCIKIKLAKKTIFEIRFRKSYVVYNCRIEDVPSDVKYSTVTGYYMPAVIKSNENASNINDIMLDLLDKYNIKNTNTFKKEEN